jgi:hypothetical protein
MKLVTVSMILLVTVSMILLVAAAAASTGGLLASLWQDALNLSAQRRS